MEKYTSYGGIIESKKVCGNIEIRFTPKYRKLIEIILECEPSREYLETITGAIVNEIQDVLNKHLTITHSKDTVDSINDINAEYLTGYGETTVDIPIPFSDTRVFSYKYNDPFKSYFKDIEKEDENISIKDIVSFKEKIYKLSDSKTYAAIAASPFDAVDNIAALSYPSYPQPYPQPRPLSKGLSD